MELASMILIPFCIVLWSGGEDCSYSFIEVSPRVLSETWEAESGKKTPLTGLAAFVDHDAKIVYFNQYDDSMDTVIHEIKHIKCYAHYQELGVNHPNCISDSEHFMY